MTTRGLPDLVDAPWQLWTEPLVGEAVESDRRPGGPARELFGTGTSARIQAVALVTRGAPRVELVTTGTRRFRLHGIDETGETPYLTGDVSWLDDGPVSRTDSELAATLVSEVTAYRALLGAAPLTDADLPAAQDAGAIAFAAIDGVLLGLADRQRVLDAPDVTNRLRVAYELVRRERALVERLGSVPQRPDGWSPAWWN